MNRAATRSAWSSFLAIALASRLALAHGAFPVAYDLYEVDGPAGAELRVESNFGILRPVDGGGWRLMCEEAVSPGVKWFQLERDGRIYMGSGAGLHASTDRCHFTPARDAGTTVRWLERVTRTGEAPAAIVALLDVYEPGRNLQVSLDQGASIQPLASPEGLLVNAIRADPFAPGVLHATAQVTQGKYGLLAYDFTTRTWADVQPLEIGGISRVAGATSDAVFLRSSSADGQAMWRVSKADRTVTKVLDLAKGSDPTTAFLSSLPDGLWLGTAFEVPWHSTDGGLTWRVSEAPEGTTCLREFSGVRYACLLDPDGRVGVLKRVGDTWTPVLLYKDVVGMEECPADSDVGRTCPDLWPIIQIALNPGGIPSPEPAEVPESCGGCGQGSTFAALLALTTRRRRDRR